jgi:transcriptional repressor NrdR
MTALHCPTCGKGPSTVLETRHKPDGIRRRRKCYKCGHRFWTVETVIPAKPSRMQNIED